MFRRLTISYFLAPSDVVDLGVEASARAFLAPFIDTIKEQPITEQPITEQPITEHPSQKSHHRTEGPSWTVTHRDNDEILGRHRAERQSKRSSRSSTPILDEIEHAVKDNADAIFTWDYNLARPQLRQLYEKAKVTVERHHRLPWGPRSTSRRR